MKLNKRKISKYILIISSLGLILWLVWIVTILYPETSTANLGTSWSETWTAIEIIGTVPAQRDGLGGTWKIPAWNEQEISFVQYQQERLKCNILVENTFEQIENPEKKARYLSIKDIPVFFPDEQNAFHFTMADCPIGGQSSGGYFQDKQPLCENPCSLCERCRIDEKHQITYINPKGDRRIKKVVTHEQICVRGDGVYVYAYYPAYFLALRDSFESLTSFPSPPTVTAWKIEGTV